MSSSSRLRLKCQTKVVPVKKSALTRLTLFAREPELLKKSSYSVTSKISIPNFILFTKALDEKAITVTKENWTELQLVCDEFGYSGLDRDIMQVMGEVDVQKMMRSLHSAAKNVGSELDGMKKRIRTLESKQDKMLKSIPVKVEVEAKKRRAAISSLDRKIMKMTRDVPKSDPIEVTFDGIIADMTKKCGGNVVTNGVLAVYATSVYDVDEQPRNALDLGDMQSCYRSNNGPGQWLCLDFKQQKVALTGYAIRSGCLKTWILESSNDGKKWVCLSNVVDDQHLKGDFSIVKEVAFRIAKCEASRFIRLRLTGKTHFDEHQLWLHALELLGKVE